MRQPRCSAVALMLASLVLIGDIANAFAPLPATRTASNLALHSDLDDDNMPISDTSRRSFFGAALLVAFSLTTRPQPSAARYVLDEETGYYHCKDDLGNPTVFSESEVASIVPRDRD